MGIIEIEFLLGIIIPCIDLETSTMEGILSLSNIV